MYWKAVYGILLLTSIPATLIKSTRDHWEGFIFFGVMVLIGIIYGFISDMRKPKKIQEEKKYDSALDWFWNNKDYRV